MLPSQLVNTVSGTIGVLGLINDEPVNVFFFFFLTGESQIDKGLPDLLFKDQR